MCWGASAATDGSNTSIPTKVAGLTGVVALAAGDDGSSCALLASGAVQCWGEDGEGQLGDGPEIRSLVPKAVVWP